MAMIMMLPLNTSMETMETMPANIVNKTMKMQVISMPVSGLTLPSVRMAMNRPPPLN